ncbi:MAG: PTS sugar transporter subunit IIA [Spirochaetales bacterium]|nr:PTS sugar transporter subunit IIA [Spirochaetales bacterium]
MNAHAEKFIMTVPEVAEYLRIAEKTVLRLVHAGTIPATKVGNQWRFFKSVIDEWMFANMGSRTPAVPLDEKRPIHELLDPDYVLLDIAPGKKERVLEQLIAPLVNNGIIHSGSPMLKKLMFRESISSTGVGNGVAFPHVRNPKDNPAGAPPVVAGICREGTDFDSLDARPVNLFFLLCSDKDSIHLNVMSRLSYLLMFEEFRDALMKSESPGQFIEVMWERETME